ncbi:phosphoribosylanthranilate isomerase [Coraliomargarita parva]|uniref:phosphoribosylanthranilate isomerase n=1 Tax=Coraliomargarita parva TaxID=3014050 RepID=UPI0022B5B78A|nr:phosphoribosylanthranilate isomerase [Coraliomargarita parva]
MNPKLNIKICGLTEAADVALARELGADYFGFILFRKSLRHISLEKAVELARAVPEAQRVVVDVDPDPSILKALRSEGFRNFQVHTGKFEERDRLEAWTQAVGKENLWLAPRLAQDEVFPPHLLEYADTILMDSYSPSQIGGTGLTGDWDGFSRLQLTYPGVSWVLAGGLGPGNVTAALEQSGARAIDVNSGVESRPGKKDPEKLRALFRILGRI